MIVSVLQQLKRVTLDLVLAGILLGVFFQAQTYEEFSRPQQLVALKMLLVSMGFLHAHIVGKLAFPKSDWQTPVDPTNCVRIALYVIFVWAYATGG